MSTDRGTLKTFQNGSNGGVENGHKAEATGVMTDSGRSLNFDALLKRLGLPARAQKRLQRMLALREASLRELNVELRRAADVIPAGRVRPLCDLLSDWIFRLFNWTLFAYLRTTPAPAKFDARLDLMGEVFEDLAQAWWATLTSLDFRGK